MLQELNIQNYRLFENLHIPDLGQVNLFAGKNNTGKTALLEALRIWAAGGNDTVINHILKSRGQFTPALDESYKYLFKASSTQSNGTMRLFLDKLRISHEGSAYFVDEVEFQFRDMKHHAGVSQTAFKLNSNVTPDYPQDKSIFVPFNSSIFPLQQLWDDIIVLTPIENDVLEIIKIVEPRVKRIDVNTDNSKVLLEGATGPVSLKSLGDGVNQILRIAVALAASKNSLLLIDEIEAGLHHSIQEMLWEKIFHYAGKWKIQVFATTHSLDAVRTFQAVANRPEHRGKGRFFRLQRNKKGVIEAVTYDQEELATALEFEMETR